MTAPAWFPPLEGAPELCRLGCKRLTGVYARGEASPVEATRAALERADRVQTRLNAFSLVDAGGAMEAALESEHRWLDNAPLSAIDGVPCTIKDIMSVKGWPLRFGSRATHQEVQVVDAPAVQRLREAGAILIGQTTTPEFGWKALTDSPLYGVTRNPWQPAYAAGGSSGGAAVAAACGAGVLHLGTDGGGSIRIPAAFSGVAGFKPTFGRVPAYPPSAFGTVAHLGPLARCVTDLRSMLRVMAGRDVRDWSQGVGALPPLSDPRPTALKGLRVGLWLRPASGSTDPLIEALACRVARWLEAQGAQIESFELPHFDLLGIFQVHWFSAAANRIADIPSSLHAQMDPSLLRIVELGKRYSAQDLAAGQATRAEFGRQMDESLERFDFLLSPATTVCALPCGVEVPPNSGQQNWTEWAGFSYPLNLSQQPACVIRMGHHRNGLPIGIQLVAARGEDARLLDVAEAIEGQWQVEPPKEGAAAS